MKYHAKRKMDTLATMLIKLIVLSITCVKENVNIICHVLLILCLIQMRMFVIGQKMLRVVSIIHKLHQLNKKLQQKLFLCAFFSPKYEFCSLVFSNHHFCFFFRYNLHNLPIPIPFFFN